MRSTVDFIDPGIEPNPDGSMPDPIPVVSGVPAKIEAISGRELYKTQQVIDEVVYRVTIPYMTEVKSRHLITFEGRTWEIYAILDPDMLHHELRIMCTETEDGT